MPQVNVQSNNSQSGANNNSSLGLSRSATIELATKSVLESLTSAELADHRLVEEKVLSECQMRIEVENTFRSKGSKWQMLNTLLPAQIADIILYSYKVVSIVVDGDFSHPSDTDLLALYNDSGYDEGIYTSNPDKLLKLARSYSYSMTTKDFVEVQAVLKANAPRVGLCRDRNLIAVNNGIFDYDTKVLHPFDPNKVFTTKSRVDYNPNAYNVVIHNDEDGTDWDVENWMCDLSDDSEVVNLLWCILGAIIRPNVRWNKSAWFYSESGNNGKGTLCVLMRELCGAGSYASISLSDFSKEFMLEPLVYASAIIVDENDVGTFIDKAANLKAVITGDSILINRKYKSPIIATFRGFMVQCLNEMPRIKDRSDSFFRRQLFVPFMKTFMNSERKYIKDDYLHRKEVLEYVLYRVLNMSYYELPVPAVCVDALEAYKEFVDPVRAFMIEMMPLFQWDLLPYQFLYELYVEWYRRTSGGDRNVRGRQSFIKDVQRLVSQLFKDWVYTDKVSVRSGTRMDNAEPLILEYNLRNWMNPLYISSNDPDKKCRPLLLEKYKGIYKK